MGEEKFGNGLSPPKYKNMPYKIKNELPVEEIKEDFLDRIQTEFSGIFERYEEKIAQLEEQLADLEDENDRLKEQLDNLKADLSNLEGRYK